MASEQKDIGKGLFGYRKGTVEQALADRDSLIRQAEERAEDAETRVEELEEHIARMQEQMGGHDEQVEEQVRLLGEQLSAKDREVTELRAQVEDLAARAENASGADAGAPSPDTVGEEIARVLRSAEESAAMIVQRARETADRQTAESDRQWREMQATMARFASWRAEVDGKVEDLKSSITEIRRNIAEIPDRVRTAFGPLAESAAAADASQADHNEDMNSPLLPAPGATGGHPGQPDVVSVKDADPQHVEFDPARDAGVS
jgi:chromosome segregation ATPase